MLSIVGIKLQKHKLYPDQKPQKQVEKQVAINLEYQHYLKDSQRGKKVNKFPQHFLYKYLF